MRRIVALSVVLVSLLSSLGCGYPSWSETKVRTGAAAQLACSERDIRVEEVSPERFKASGCGKVAFYRCTGESASATPTCTRETSPP